MEQKRSEKKQSLWGLTAIFVLTVVTFCFLAGNHSMADLKFSLRQARPVYIVLGIVCMLGSIWLEAYTLKLLFKGFQRKVSWKRAMGYSFVGFYFSAITPSATGGQPMQAYYMSRDKIELSQSSFVLMVTASFYQMMVLIYGVLMFLLHITLMKGQLPIIRWLFLLGILINGGASFFLLTVVMNEMLAEKIVKTVVRIFTRLHIVKRPEALLKKVRLSIQEYKLGGEYLKKHKSVALKVMILTFLRLTCLYLIPYAVCLALGIQGKHLIEFLAVQAVLSLCVTAVPLPGSIGASEGCSVILYRLILDAKDVLPVMVLSRGISFYGFLAVSGCVVLWLHYHKRKEDYVKRELQRCS